MRLFHEIHQMVILKRQPFGVDLPQHILRGHFCQTIATSATAFAIAVRLINTQQILEGMAHFVRQGSKRRFPHPYGRGPEYPDFVVVTTTVSCCIFRINNEYQALILITDGITFLHKFEVIYIKLINAFPFFQNIIHIKSKHRIRIGHRVCPKFLRPENSQIFRLLHPFKAVFASVCLQTTGLVSDILRNIQLLRFNGKDI